MSRGSSFIAVPSKYIASSFSEITLNTLNFEQLLRMRVSRDIKLISGRYLRLVQPLRFKKTRRFIFSISRGSVSNATQPSRFNS